MDDNRPRARDRKVSYIAPVIIACVVAGLVAFILLRQPPPPSPAETAPGKPIAQAVPASPPKPLVAPAPLQRGDLITNAARAAALFARTGRNQSGSDPLVGRRFSIRLPFGCDGMDGGSLNPQITTAYDAGKESLTLTAQPGIWTTLPLMQPLVEAGKAETVEGFWVPRPWTDSEACPPPGLSQPPVIITPPTAQTLGLAQSFAPGGARTRQRGDRPYTVTVKVPASDTSLLGHSFRLLLEGVVAGYPDGQALRCWSEAADHQPICIYAVTFDHVAFVDGDTGAVLATWTD